MGWLATCARVAHDALSLPRPLDLDAPPAARFGVSPRPVDQLLTVMWQRQGLTGPAGRDEALSVAAVQRGRNALCSVATLPLRLYRGLDIVESPLLAQLDPDVANVVTLAQTIEDLAFDGISWWLVTAKDFAGFPVAVRHLDVATVSLDAPAGTPNPFPSGRDPRGVVVVWVAGKPVPADQLIRFDSPNPGLLAANARSIRRALLLDQLAAVYADNPRPLDYFTDTDDPTVEPFTQEEREAFLDDWESQRKLRSTGWIPGTTRRVDVDAPSPLQLQLVELQRQVTLEIANGLGVDPEDLGVSTTSRTYFNAQDRRMSKVNETYAPYMSAITQRLSMGDVTRRGYEVRFDLTDYLKPDPAAQAAYWRALKDMGVMDAAEIRAAAGLSGPPPAQDAPAPEPAEGVDASAAVARFSGLGELFTFDVPTANFSVDAEKRTITGLAVPFGQRVFHEHTQQFWEFEAGSVTFAEPGRVKLLRDHDPHQPLGRAVELTETPAGLMAKFSVAPGADGDRALELALHGTLDGLSVGVGRGGDGTTRRDGTYVPRGAPLREISLTAVPAFDDSRLTSVTASLRKETTMPDAPEQNAPAAPAAAPEQTTTTETPADGQAAQFAAFQAWQAAQQAERPAVVNPVRPTAAAFVQEALPYRFSHRGGRHVFASDAEHDFSADLFEIVRAQQARTDFSAPLARVNGLIRAAFADVETADVTALNPNRHRPDMWQPQQDYATPLWDMVAAGTTDGTKFDVPKFTSSSGLVSAATEKTEPAAGSYVAELQTVTPTQVWGKVEVTRQAWRQGGSPQLSGILWDQMLREYYEDREAAVATFLNTLTSATDITITGTPAATPVNDDDQVSARDLEMAIAALQFVRGGNRFRAFAVHIDLYKLLARVTDDAGRPLYPMRNPQNANGTAADLFGTLNIAGTTAVPSWALGSSGTAAANSWLFDPAKVRGWASAPERLFWDFGATVQTANIPQLSFVTLGIYGDVAFANTDINGVRQVIFDPSV